MKLCYILLLALVAMVTADSHEYQQNSYPQEGASPSNYYSQKHRQQSGLAGILGQFFGSGATRRQFTGPGTGTGTGFTTGGGFVPSGLGAAPLGVAPAATGGLTAASLAPYLFIALLLGIGIAGLIAAFSLLDFNSSGRGLDTDEWEVDHSVWMNQLQKDFEDSWSTE